MVLGMVVGGTYLGLSQNSKLQEEMAGVENKVVVDEEENKVEFKQTDVLPENFPKDFPVYEKAKMEGYWTASGKSLDGISAVWKTPDDPAGVITFYKSELLKSGWEMTTVFEDSKSGTFTISKENSDGFVGITREGEETTISVTVGLPQ